MGKPNERDEHTATKVGLLTGRFRKRPVEVEATQWDGGESDGRRIEAWADSWHEGSLGLVKDDDKLIIVVYTIEGAMATAQPYDWIIRGIQGEFYPCKPDIFKETYEPVE